jgi:hypothetical protein
VDDEYFNEKALGHFDIIANDPIPCAKRRRSPSEELEDERRRRICTARVTTPPPPKARAAREERHAVPAPAQIQYTSFGEVVASGGIADRVKSHSHRKKAKNPEFLDDDELAERVRDAD